MDEIYYRFTLCGAASFRDLIDFEPVELSAVGHKHQRIVSIARKEALDKVVVVRSYRDLAFAAAFLLLVLLAWHAFDVASMRDGYDHIFVRDEVLDVDIVVVIHDLGDARHFKFIFYFKQLVFD